MKTKLVFAILAFSLFLSQAILAQDIILKKDTNMIKCKIKEIGLDDIKYTLPEYSQDVTFAIDKDNVAKIIFENGKEMSFQKEMNNPDNYTDNKKNALKINFLSPLYGSTSFSYERSLRPSRSIEGTLGIIGLGTDNWDENPGGVFVKFGYKFIKDPDFYLRGMRYAHILKGAYFKPEFGFASFGRDDYSWDYYSGQSPSNKRETVTSAVLQIVMGKQWIVDNAFLIDFYAGLGYGFSTSDNTNYHYAYSIADSSVPISFSSGLKIGFLFK
jgi:hypothetical protein